jgi:hypothetical protein
MLEATGRVPWNAARSDMVRRCWQGYGPARRSFPREPLCAGDVPRPFCDGTPGPRLSGPAPHRRGASYSSPISATTEPTILLTNDAKSSAKTIITRYAKRMLIENALSDAVRFFLMAVPCRCVPPQLIAVNLPTQHSTIKPKTGVRHCEAPLGAEAIQAFFCSCQVLEQVTPGRIQRFNQGKLLLSRSSFDLFLL